MAVSKKTDLESRELHLREIIRLAEKAFDKGEVPVGAVIMDRSGRVIGRGYNQTHARRDGLQHAELNAIRSAQRKLGDWRLDGATLYVTLEPCLMCLGAIGNARISKVCYLLSDPLFGSVESKLSRSQLRKLFPKLQTERLPQGERVQELMQEFFKGLRQAK